MTEAEKVLKRHYGYSSFRPGQAEIIDNVLKGRDVLVLMPTGGGKSLCYQIPALMLPGCAIVVSPLIALMNDQVQALRANGLPAVAIHSNQDERINQENMYEAACGRIKMIYISPERLMLELHNISANMKVSLIAIDEAHCISQWGHDFRPVYTELKTLKSHFPDVPVMALTATADRLTRTDISESLGLHNPYCHIGSFDRPNISLTVLEDPGKRQRLKVIEALINKYRLDSGIVYCLSRKKTEDMHEALLEMGYRSVCYHAGLSAEQREEAQRAFVNGDVQVVCATIAFGMGIDKSNIRWVVHNNIPGNIESYYQEIGRAGRDGMPAEAIMFYSFADIMMRRNFVDGSGRQEINSEKLDFMQRYAESDNCRRRILLSYFSEERVENCGNCDNCRAPRRKFDGTIVAQKALSAVIRVRQKEGIQTIIDILRASARQEIMQKGYDQLKTYGAGRDLSYMEWNSYILQMIQLGVLEVAYEDSFHLRPTPLGMRVVRGEQRIELSVYNPDSFGKRNGKKTKAAPAEVRKSPEEQITDALKELRKTISEEQHIPAYMVFSDASLNDMVKRMPTDIEKFSEISGVGEVKLAKYGRRFVELIRAHKGLKKTLPAGTSQRETLLLFNSGMSPQAIADARNLNLTTVYSHLCKWIDEDKLSDFRRLIPASIYTIVERIMLEDPENLYGRLADDYQLPSYLVRTALAEKRWRERHS